MASVAASRRVASRSANIRGTGTGTLTETVATPTERERKMAASPTPGAMRALAAELLRAQRENDRTGFDKALLQSEGNVPAMVISLCGLANKAMDQVIGRREATELVTRLAQQMEEPARRDLFADDIWREAVDFLEAVGDDDAERASTIMNAASDLLLFHGYVTQAIGEIMANVPEDTRTAWIAQLRAMPPRSL